MKPYDVVVVGGGIAGLWSLAALRSAGYRAILLEKAALGAGQTLASQGIIHGGTKYALTGKLTGSSEAVRAMPGRWKQHLSGSVQPDLSACTINTHHQWMWDAGGVTARVSSFFASRVMSSRVQPLSAEARPEFLQDKTVYELQEPVLDVQSVLGVLAGQNRSALFHAEVVGFEQSGGHLELEVLHDGRSQTLCSRCVVFSAGEGNEGLQTHAMQRRPLHMVMVKGQLPELWGHVIEANANPVLTVTTHRDAAGEVVWYLGGQLAEDGIGLDRKTLVSQVMHQMQTMFPTIDWATRQWATLKINRAEGRQPGNVRPDQPVIQRDDRVITVWPTKLVFAPLVADEVKAMVEAMSIQPGLEESAAPDLPEVAVGDYPWNRAEWVSSGST